MLPALLLSHSGPVDQVLPFFNTLGYACPERKDPGSFLQVKPTGRREGFDVW